MPYGATAAAEPAAVPASSFHAAFDGLRIGARVPAFWLLAASFAICGMTTNGLIGTHFIPAANDHGMPTTVAAGLLATIGILDVAGTVFSGWLTDRVDPRCCWSSTTPGGDIAAVAAVAALAARRAEHLGVRHLLRPGLGGHRAADDRVVPQLLRYANTGRLRLGVRLPSAGRGHRRRGAGWLRDLNGDYDMAFYLAAGLCVGAAVLGRQMSGKRTSRSLHHDSRRNRSLWPFESCL